MKVLITGSSGLVGTATVQFLKNCGYEVIRMVRQKEKLASDTLFWNPDIRQIDPPSLEGFHAVIHLSGENIASNRWTEEKKQAIRDSRLKSTQFLSETLASLKKPPKVVITASAIGYYGNQSDQLLDENSPSGMDFLAEVCRVWEGATTILLRKDIRVVHARLGVVLSNKGGALKKMLLPFKLGLGGVMGTGEQIISWIALDDVTRAFKHIMTHPELEGPVNLTAPKSITNRLFTKTLGQVLHRPTIFPLPATLAKFIFGEMANALFLSSANVAPKRLQDTGFHFLFPNLKEALEHLLNKRE